MPEAEGKPVDFLIKRLRENRKGKVTVGKFTFTYRRPTDREAAEWYRSGAKDADIYLNYVSDWGDVTEDDVIGGGGSDALAFDLGLWREWVVDRTDFWEPIVIAVIGAYREHQKSMEDAEKK